MGLALATVVPWGRSLAEYRRMFDLQTLDPQQRILDCGGGPASFNAELTHQGYQVISCDPIYQFSAAQIQQRITETYPVIVAGTRANQHHYVWREIESPEALGKVRMAAMQQFLADFPDGYQEQRYRPDALPDLSFGDRQFDLALCSHLLFTYSDHFSYQFHLDSVRELCRVASVVKVFPLLKVSGDPSPFVQPIVDTLTEQGYGVTIQPVAYEFQRGGNQLLVVTPPTP